MAVGGWPLWTLGGCPRRSPGGCPGRRWLRQPRLRVASESFVAQNGAPARAGLLRQIFRIFTKKSKSEGFQFPVSCAAAESSPVILADCQAWATQKRIHLVQAWAAGPPKDGLLLRLTSEQADWTDRLWALARSEEEELTRK